MLWAAPSQYHAGNRKIPDMHNK